MVDFDEKGFKLYMQVITLYMQVIYWTVKSRDAQGTVKPGWPRTKPQLHGFERATVEPDAERQ